MIVETLQTKPRNVDAPALEAPTKALQSPGSPWSTRFQLLGEHHDDAAGAADIGELVDVLVGRDAAQRVAAMPRGNLEGLVDVVDREGDAVMPISLGRVGFVSIALGW